MRLVWNELKYNGMKGSLKYLWAILAGLVVLPLIVNLCCYFHSDNGVFGEPRGWTMFLGSYIGAITSCLVTFYVLSKQLEQNHKENSYNRQLQINAIEYQQRTQWLTELKGRLYDLESVFHRSDFDSLADLFTCDMKPPISMDYQTKILEKINWIFSKASSAILPVNTMFTEKRDDFETESLVFFNENIEELYAVLDDLQWFIYNVECMFASAFPHTTISTSQRRSTQDYINRTNAYKEIEHSHSSKSRRIWEIIESLQYRRDYNAKLSIVYTRIREALNQIDLPKIHKAIATLIEHEQEKINAILKTDNA
ncbi:MAG: hypothetical protein LUD72_13995 [Bacteroidales bacterium]|nr:hypothetical protein [Bacteroidales bacterium]